jgi:hypothetical protein
MFKTLTEVIEEVVDDVNDTEATKKQSLNDQLIKKTLEKKKLLV